MFKWISTKDKMDLTTLKKTECLKTPEDAKRRT